MTKYAVERKGSFHQKEVDVSPKWAVDLVSFLSLWGLLLRMLSSSKLGEIIFENYTLTLRFRFSGNVLIRVQLCDPVL